MINSRKIEDLHPRLQGKCNAFIAACKARGLDVLITATYRDAEYQNTLYAKGRTVPGPIVTNAKGGDSMHNYRLAFDFVPLVGGQPAWNSDILWVKCGSVAQSVGLEWGGNWTKFADKPHCQDTGGLSLAQLKEGVTLA